MRFRHPLLHPLLHGVLLAACVFAPLAGCSSDADDAAAPDASVADAGGVDTSDAAPDAGGDAAGDATGDAAGDAVAAVEPAWCEGATAHRWEPLDPTDLDFFPDGLLVRDDSASPTGQRLELTEETAPWIVEVPELLRDSVLAMNALSGFGTLGGALLRFSAPVSDVPTDAASSLESAGWQWWDLGVSPAERVPFEGRVLEDGLTVVLWPLRPLALGSDHALVLTTDALADDGGCIAPAPTTRRLLWGDDASLPNTARIAQFDTLYRDTLATLGIAPEAVSAITVFRTHDDLLPIRAAAEDVLTRPVAWGPSMACAPRDRFFECEATTTVLDYRNARGVVDDTVTPREAEIPVTVWLPSEGAENAPVLVYGHGLNSTRGEGWEIASRLAGEGFAVVAMEAVEHGAHPFIDPAEGSEPALRFLGIDLANLSIDAERIRGNFNQTNIDRIRLVNLLRTDGDFDGDGIAELDPTRVGYVGASLGAMCGAGLLALSPDLDAAVLTIGGARLMSIVTDTAMIESFRPLIGNLVGSPELFDRLVPVAQHLVDAADPGLWAAHVLRDRFDDRTPPSVLAAFGMDDDVVPPASGRALARALGAPHLAPVVVPLDLVETIDAAPVSANWADGQRTAATFQFDRVTRGDSVRAARHTDTAKSDESAEQIRAFFVPWAAGEVPVAIDPYAVLNTPPRPEE